MNKVKRLIELNTKKDKNGEEIGIFREAKAQVENANRLPQRRIYITPTLKVIAPMKVEQSNVLLRRLHRVLEYMIRVNITEDNF